MAKSKERILARSLRKHGYSVKTISRELQVSRSSVSIWVRDINLTPEQVQILNQNSVDGRNKGRTLTSLMYKNRREKIHAESLEAAQQLLKHLTNREFLIAGIALYWAEGNKKTHTVRFTNSDPKMIVFALNWLRSCFDLPIDRFGAFVGINKTNEYREDEIIQYWSKITGIPMGHFRKSIFQKSKSKKICENNSSYFGTLTIFVWKPIQVYYKIMGLIEALSQNNQLPV
jgi:DNA-binding MarR family transcriptional regulator